MTDIQKDLFALADVSFKKFHGKLIPTISAERVIGVKIPVLRQYAKTMTNQQKQEFLATLPHTYYEENMLHGLLLSREKEWEVCAAKVEEFLPFVDNWAVCDSLRPKCFAKAKEPLLPYIQKWLDSPHEYTCRFAMEMLMVHFLEDGFSPCHLQWVAAVNREEYYVKMMISWYFATALAKQWQYTLPYLENRRLDAFCHAKTIQKAVESYRISPVQKEQLKALK